MLKVKEFFVTESLFTCWSEVMAIYDYGCLCTLSMDHKLLVFDTKTTKH